MEREYRPAVPVVERGEGSDQDFTVGNPVDLARNIRAIVQQEQANRSKDFNPASWLRTKIDVIFHEAVPGEKQTFFYTLRAAWDLVAYKELDGEHSESVYDDISGCIDVIESTTLTLNSLGVTLLDAMAEALDIPHTGGQAEFDISLFGYSATMQRIRDGALYSSPSLEEVRQAIAPKEVVSS